MNREQLDEAISLFQAKIESQGMVVNERDAEHLKHLIEVREKEFGYNQMVKIWFDDMEEMFQIKLSEWEKLKDNALPPYNNYSEHLKVDDEEWEWGSDASELEFMYHRIKVWREGYAK